jgi:hypothetical protein
MINKEGKMFKKDKHEALNAQKEFKEKHKELFEPKLTDEIVSSKLLGLSTNWSTSDDLEGNENYSWLRITINVTRVNSSIVVAGRTYSSYYKYYTTFTWLTTPGNRIEDGFSTYVDKMMTLVSGSQTATAHYTKNVFLQGTSPVNVSLSSNNVSCSSPWSGSAYKFDLPSDNQAESDYNFWFEQGFKTVVSPIGSQGAALVAAQYSHLQSTFNPTMGISFSTTGSAGFSFNPSSWVGTSEDEVQTAMNIDVY